MSGSNDTVLRTVDAAAAGTMAATLFGWLPELAALFTIVWTGIRIWETDTVRSITGRAPGKPTD